MLKHRIYWLLCWLASLIFLIFYQQWLAWLFLGAVLLIPLFSLLVSLPAMVTTRLDTAFPERLEQHTNGTPRLECRCPFITPHWSCRIRITRNITPSPPGNTIWRQLGLYSDYRRNIEQNQGQAPPSVPQHTMVWAHSVCCALRFTRRNP